MIYIIATAFGVGRSTNLLWSKAMHQHLYALTDHVILHSFSNVTCYSFLDTTRFVLCHRRKSARAFSLRTHTYYRTLHGVSMQRGSCVFVHSTPTIWSVRRAHLVRQGTRAVLKGRLSRLKSSWDCRHDSTTRAVQVHWLKTGIEWTDGRPWLSVVVCNVYRFLHLAAAFCKNFLSEWDGTCAQ